MQDEPFSVADGLRAGLTPAQLRAARWRTPFHGVREPRDAPQTFVTRCRALAKVLPPDAAFSGITAARLYGWWLPWGADQLPLHVTVPPARVVDRAGLRCSRRLFDSRDVVEWRGLRVTTALRTLRDLSADWPLLDLAVMADAALRSRACTTEQLAALAALGGHRGAGTLRRAAAVADARSESPMETVLRLALVVPGLPPPTPQVVICDSGGGFLARVDLLGADGVSVLEYDGAAHDEPRRHAADVSRWRLLRREGYEVYPYTLHDVALGAPVIFDYQRALGLPEDPRAVERWLGEWARSSFGRYRWRGGPPRWTD